MLMVTKGGGCRGEGESRGGKTNTKAEEQQNQLSLVALLLAAIRKSIVSCKVDQSDEVVSGNVQQMEIGLPTNVRHITHVTFDRFNGFLGLPVEFEVEVPGRVPSASASVFGVSAESMQCSYDSKGNSVPTILLLMQERLYSQGGLKAEGIFRINPENSKEEHVRDQLNRGRVPDDIDVHCLAGLIKAWFRELPEGILDGLSPEDVLQCGTEEQFVELVKQLLPIQAGLLSWAVDLMADVVEEEELNKMNARNIAMVFAPNMTQMSDPLTALMHAVQVMNLLKALILKTLREREETTTGYSPCSSHYSDQRTDEESDYCQQEMDTSCELKGPISDYDNQANSQSSEDEDDNDSLSEIEECFLGQLDGKQELTSDAPVDQVSPSSRSGINAGSGLSFSEEKNDAPVDQVSPSSRSGINAGSGLSFSEEKNDAPVDQVSPSSRSFINAGSGLSFSEEKNEHSCSSTIDVEDSMGNEVVQADNMKVVQADNMTQTDSPSEAYEGCGDVEMSDKQLDSLHSPSSPVHV